MIFILVSIKLLQFRNILSENTSIQAGFVKFTPQIPIWGMRTSVNVLSLFLKNDAIAPDNANE